METLKTTGATARLPEDVPDGVHLLDQSWLSEQNANGARLILVEPHELERIDGAAAALRAELGRAVVDRDRAQAEHDRLESERDEADTALAALEARFTTQQSAGKALLATVAELERRGHEREKRARSLDSRLRFAQAEAEGLRRALALAERPLWRKLLRRPA